MQQAAKAALGPGDMQRALEEKLLRPGSVFTPGHRIRMNVVPIVLNVMVPWSIFCLCCGLTSFSLMYRMPGFVSGSIAGIFTLWAASVVVALWARHKVPEPTWYTYCSLMVGVAAITGTVCGLSNYRVARRFYEVRDLKVIHGLDVSHELGQKVLDAGIVLFSNASHLDLHRSWHFKHRTVYCVVPIVGNESQPETRSYDFWAVGTDCCSASSSDFRCGAWRSARAHGAVRVLDEEALPFYRLAVRQAETLYGFVAAHPVFFRWSPDPVSEVRSWDARAFRNFLLMVGSALAVSVIAATAATWRFSWLGRASSAYAMDFYDEPMWRSREGRMAADPRLYGSV